jgi:hypothetical protein
VAAPASAHATDALVLAGSGDEGEQQLGDTMVGADVADHRRIDGYLGLDLEGPAVAGMQHESLGTTAGHDALEDSRRSSWRG